MVDTVLLSSLIGFAFIGSITPGPNNLMVMASAAAFGWRRAVPHMLGIMFGFGIMLALVTSGLGALILEVPVLLDVVKFGGAAWLLWLAFKMARGALQPSDPAAPDQPSSKARPLTMLEAMLFQWVNPKGWAMALACAGAYVELAPSVITRAALIALVFMAMTPFANGTWMAAGEAMHRLFTGPRAGKFFGLGMAFLIAATAVMIVLGPSGLP
jgi:threonine/homoserine/homoserine lactone efflux protein